MTQDQAPVLYLVLPCYNEEAMLPLSLACLLEKIRDWKARKLISPRSRLFFVDDGSTDRTWPLLEAAHLEHEEVEALRLSRNFGHQNALHAGLQEVVGQADYLVSLDADLQDSPGLIESMLRKAQEGYDLVLGVRDSRQADRIAKRWSARLFYYLLGKTGVEVIPDHADFRLLSKRAALALLSYPERELYLRGLVPLLGFPSARLFYDRQPRQAGESKYSLLAMLSLARKALFGFSDFPLRLLLLISALLGLGSLVCLLISSPLRLMAWVGFCTALLLFGMGLVGLYVARTLREVQARPRYFIQERLHHD